MARGADMDTSFKDRCISLRKSGLSLTEIARETGRAKTSIYPYIYNIPLSRERLALSRQRSGEHIRLFALARKGVSAKAFKPFSRWNGQAVLLVAHLLFDGEINERRGCAYNNRSKALIDRVARCVQLVYDFEPKYYTNPLTRVRRISYYNVALAIYLRGKADELTSSINTFSLPLKREFLRAFFDDEGCMDFRPRTNQRKVRGYQKDVALLQLIRTLLADFKIPAKVVMPNEVVITGKENLILFEKEINFSKGVSMNGARTNSRWKKDLEKRAILRMAIESYKN